MKTDGMSEEEINERHSEKMAKKKAARDKMLAAKQEEKGLLMVHTGKGKGKSTAAMGLALRAIGNDMNVVIVQYVKGAMETGERVIFDKFPELCTIRAMGEGFTWDTQDRARDIELARAAWDYTKEVMADPAVDMVVLDEINIVIRYDYLPIDEVVEVLSNKLDDLHIVATGRNAKDELIDVADLVTDMTQIKHHFRAGVKAQKGIEF